MKTLKIQVMPFMYASAKECIQDKNHLTALDEDGYCKLCGYKDSAQDVRREEVAALRQEVRNWMLMALDSDLESYLDTAGMWDCTALAENAALNFNHEEWLNDDTHWVWDLAIEVTEGYKR